MNSVFFFRVLHVYSIYFSANLASVRLSSGAEARRNARERASGEKEREGDDVEQVSAERLAGAKDGEGGGGVRGADGQV